MPELRKKSHLLSLAIGAMRWGQTVAEDVDVARESGGRNVAMVREFKGVNAGGSLKIDLTPSAGRPVLSGIEVVTGAE